MYNGTRLFMCDAVSIKELAQKIIKLLSEVTLLKALLLLILMIVLLKLVDLFFKPLAKKNSIHISFSKNVIQAFIIIFFLIQIGSLSDAMAGFFSSILMSSSLIVVVLGFVFQEGLSNIVHGFILGVFKPFNIGDRVKVTIDGVTITGYVRSVNMRNTVIQNVYNNSFVIVPNAKMDLSVIDNSYFDEKSVSSNFLDVQITYESDLDKACQVISQTIDNHPLVKKAKKPDAPPTDVLVNQLGDSGICLRASVVTSTIEENFTACSDIRKELVRLFNQDKELDMAYPHMCLVPYSDGTKKPQE